MIFVTVGSQLPFKRLIEAMDLWAGDHKDQPIFAQIGDSDYLPKNMTFCQSMTPIEYDKRLKEATLVISHVGTGVIINALEQNKPLLLMPRLLDKKEIRNNHQLTSVDYFSTFSNITIAPNEKTLDTLLTQMLDDNRLENKPVKPTISDELITVIQKFVAA
ncbi:MAG: hypothetical protein KAG10_10555 [Methylococcales bacterium]|nr:hypothetical protein [Methylococcales bacterium]MCK5926325.1 hypothetical protein [Methylococcales bacterium]